MLSYLPITKWKIFLKRDSTMIFNVCLNLCIKILKFDMLLDDNLMSLCIDNIEIYIVPYYCYKKCKPNDNKLSQKK